MRRKRLGSMVLVFNRRDARKNWHLVENTVGNLNNWANRSDWFHNFIVYMLADLHALC